MDATGMIVLTIPVLFPLVVGLGFDPLWFSVLGVIMIEAGLITPPIGINVYVIGGIAPDVPLSKIFRGIMPFLFAIIACAILIMIFPKIALILPKIIS
jgi:TRAP-type C4-dicarboxylate transport system permease large subunit